MKVLLYIHDLKNGGAQKCFVLLANSLSSKGVDVAVSTLNKGVISNQLNSNVVLYEMKSKRTLFSFREFHKVVKDFKPTHIFTGLLQNNIFLVLFKLIFKCKSKIIISEHSIPSQIPKEQLNFLMNICSSLRCYFYVNANKVIAVSDACKQDLVSHYRLPNHIIERIYNPVNISISQAPMPQEFEALKAVYKYLFIGRIHKIKRLDLLLIAFEKLVNKDANNHLFIMGDGPEFESICKLSIDLNLNDHITFLGYDNEPSIYLRFVDCLVLTSTIEGFGNVVVEALAHAKPVISTYSFGPEEIIEHGKHGLLSDSSISNLVLSMENVKKYIWIEEILRDRAKDFSQDIIALKYMDVFENV